MNLPFLLLLILLPFFLFLFLIYKPFTKITQKNLPPGPRKLPLLGNLLQMVGSLPHHAFTTLAKKDGPIIHLQLGENSTIVISSAHLAKEALTTHDLALADRATNKAAHQIFYNCTDIAFSPYSNYWRQMRKICTLELLSATKFKSFESIRHEEMSNLIDSIRTTSGTSINLGTNSAATTIECAMTEMLRKPSIMNKAQVEIRQALKGKTVLNEADIQNLTYLKLVLKETLRLHPTGPLLIPRKCRKQCEISGYTVPVNAHFIVNIWAIARDPEYWDNAESFEPERFENSSYQFNGSSFEYMPFGAGRRMCPGIIFGTGNVELTLAKLLFHFDWKLPDGMRAEDIDMTEVFGGTTKLKKNLFAVATPYSPH